MRWLISTLLVALVGCDQGGVSRPASAMSVGVDSSAGPGRAFVVLSGLSSEELRVFRALPPGSDSIWQSFARVTVDDPANASTSMAVAGDYSTSNSAVEFRPRFPFDAGRTYLVSVNARAAQRASPDSLLLFRFALPAGDRTPRTAVRAIFPGSDTVPENLLRLYIEFSAPMSRTGGLAYITLRDEGDLEVKSAFLPLDADFWNDDRTRYTAFLDPGRVKRGILPNEQMGRAIRQGHRYSVVVDSNWRDANGIPLTATYRRSFYVGEPDERVIDVGAWRVSSPSGGTKNALQVAFPKPLDHGLLVRALGVESTDGAQVFGTVDVARNGREWRFTPRENWRNGAEYRLLVLSILEDPAGNRIDRPFEVDMFDRVDRTAAPERRTIPFRTGAPQ